MLPAGTSAAGPMPSLPEGGRVPRHPLGKIRRMAGAHRFHVRPVLDRLEAKGGYEIVHESPNVEVGVYVLVAPEPDRQQPHAYDEVYVVLEGDGVLTVEGEDFPLYEGDSIFVPAGAEHRFTGYAGLSLLVFFAKTHDSDKPAMSRQTTGPLSGSG
jgi:mannose-6-phosphate isomerase-like protein (cupin superfamily)